MKDFSTIIDESINYFPPDLHDDFCERMNNYFHKKIKSENSLNDNFNFLGKVYTPFYAVSTIDIANIYKRGGKKWLNNTRALVSRISLTLNLAPESVWPRIERFYEILLFDAYFSIIFDESNTEEKVAKCHSIYNILTSPKSIEMYEKELLILNSIANYASDGKEKLFELFDSNNEVEMFENAMTWFWQHWQDESIRTIYGSNVMPLLPLNLLALYRVAFGDDLDFGMKFEIIAPFLRESTPGEVIEYEHFSKIMDSISLFEELAMGKSLTKKKGFLDKIKLGFKS